MTLKLAVVPEKAIVIRREGTIVAASWFGPWVRRPYIYPFLAPGDREVTRLGHPGDPVGHSHHRSIWIGHHDVGGVDFWGERRGSGRIVQEDIGERVDEGERVGALLSLSWRDAGGKEIVREKRRLAFIDLPGSSLALELDIELLSPEEPVVLGVTNFGLLGIRVARTLRVHEGLGGRILNSQEAENEAGCFGQHAVWCDYSGPVPMAPPRTKTETEPKSERESRTPPAAAGLPHIIVGIACFDHPQNSAGGEALWHVRDDGWMGPSLTRREPRTVAPGRPLRVRYRLESHAGRAGEAFIDEKYRAWRKASSR